MKNSPNLLILSGLFFVAFLLVEFTEIYGDSGWFKVFALIVSASFLISGILQKRQSRRKDH